MIAEIMAAPVLAGWALGYLEVRSKYDVQIFTSYLTVYEEKDFLQDEYSFNGLSGGA